MDIIQAIGTILLLTFLGILVAFNPLLVAVDFVIVLKGKRPIFNTIVLAMGFVCSIAIMFFIANSLIDPDSEVSLGRIKENLSLPPMIDIFAGSLLLAWSASRRLNPKPININNPAKSIAVPQKPKQLFIFALVKTSLSVTNIFSVLILAKISASYDWSTFGGLFAFLWLTLIGLIPLAAMAYFHEFKRSSLLKADRKINSFLSGDISKIINYSLAIVGAFFLTSGMLEILKP